MLLRILIFLKTANALAEDFTDYCALLGEDDIQGKKHGFMAGNKVTMWAAPRSSGETQKTKPLA